MDIFLSILGGLIAGLWLARMARQGARDDAAGGNELYALAGEMADYYNQSAQPNDLLGHESFKKGVKLLVGERYRPTDLVAYYEGDNAIIACMALEALRKRNDGDKDELFDSVSRSLNTVAPWTRFFALRLFQKRVDPPLIGRLLLLCDNSWDNRFCLQYLTEFARGQMERGEQPSFGEELDRASDDQADFLERAARQIGGDGGEALLDQIARWRDSRIDTTFLSSVGSVGPASNAARLVQDDRLVRRTGQVERVLLGKRPRSVLLVGRNGVGKSAVLRAVTARLAEKGWVIFNAAASDVVANQVYIGELEGRVQKMLQVLSGRRKVLWVVPAFHELMWTGRHQHNPNSVLDLVQPAIDRGDLLVAGETDPEAYERLLLSRPRLRSILEALVLEPYDDTETLALAREWWKLRAADTTGHATTPNDETLAEALLLSRQYLGQRAAPGNLIQLLRLTLESRPANADSSPPRTAPSASELLATVSRLTGLPLSILDDQQSIDVRSLRSFFESRVMGQGEAVNCLVERVALVKAGLTDPTRPAGVFLFTGPTGTGKTELCKALAEFLFGSPERMVRLDMSEFQTEDSLSRILGDGGSQGGSAALVNQVRNQPFSVLLLDEFEKAHPRIWDLFLQLFDDGRLTDRQGNTADFRHSIVIMTSNLGGDLSRAGSIGFGGESSPDSQNALEGAFRKEFLNRIDRVVVFQPLRRSVMREILLKELDQVLARRGLRNRAWAVEWEESAIDFLLDAGFTRDMGARPLKRAIEQHLLAPLALTIVDHRLPQGDQFLFVRSGGQRLEVVFVDPDQPENEEARVEPAGEDKARPRSLTRLALDASGVHTELEFLSSEYSRISAVMSDPGWVERKEQAVAAMEQPAFWDRQDRFTTLGLIEYLDRLDVGLGTAGSLLRRLSRPDGDRSQVSRPIVQRLAHQLYLLDVATSGVLDGQPCDAFLLISPGRDPGADNEVTDRFADQIGKMYRSWCSRRGMRLTILDEPGGDQRNGSRQILAISGFGAYPILARERGLHVLEIRSDGRSPARHRVRVRVQPQPDRPAHGPEELLSQALELFGGAVPEQPEIVRRYREEPSPLVRDSVRNWRTGRLDRVLAGDFDLM